MKPPPALAAALEATNAPRGFLAWATSLDGPTWRFVADAVAAVRSGDHRHDVSARRWLTGQEVIARLGISSSTFQRLRKAKQFPPPIEVPGMFPRWSLADVETWERRSLEDRGNPG